MGLHPSTPAKQSTKTSPPFPIFTTLCSTTRPGGNTPQERRERWGGKRNHLEQWRGKRHWQRYMNKRGSTVGMCQVTCAKVASSFTFSPCIPITLNCFTVPQLCSFSSKIIRWGCLWDLHRVKTRGLWFPFWLLRLRRKQWGFNSS